MEKEYKIKNTIPTIQKSHQYKRYSGQVTQDVIVEGKKW